MELLSAQLHDRLNQIAEEFLKIPKDMEVQIVSHFDTDGITSAAILVKAMKRFDRKFSIRIVKNLTEEVILKMDNRKVTVFSDLASNSLEHLRRFREKVFILDHHEISQEIPEGVFLVNPQMHEKKEEISSSGLCYLFAKHLNEENTDLASLAVVGMIGDSIENLDVMNNEITKDAEMVIKKGIPLYPSTRPLNRVLEFSSEPFIPTVTGDREGTMQFLREIGFERQDGKYKSLMELTEDEMTKLVTSVLLRRTEKDNENLIGNIYLVKHFNQLEDAREMSARINAASRQGEPYTAILYCLGEASSRKKIERLHAKYRQMIISGLKLVQNLEQIKGRGYTIINARSEINDTIISVVTTILSKSSLYPEGTVIIAMTYAEDEKIKVSARTVKQGRNVRDILGRIVTEIGGEFGGHKYAAGCTFPISKENEFTEKIKKDLEIELVRV